jgi:hypothetical protein
LTDGTDRQRRIDALTGQPHDQSPARILQGPGEREREHDADQEQVVDLQRLADLRDAAPPAEVDRSEIGRLGLDEGLAEEEGEASAEQHQADAGGNVVDPRQLADAGVQRAQQQADQCRDQHAEPRRAAHQRDAVSAHRAHHQCALEAEIDAARALGKALADADEDERRADPDRARQHGQRHAPKSETGVVHQAAAFGFNSRP